MASRPHLDLAASNGLAFPLIRGAFLAIARRRPLFPVFRARTISRKGVFYFTRYILLYI
jgi:hypothetical protein